MKTIFASVLLTILIVGLLFAGNYQFVSAQPGGTDFLYRWLPTRLVLLDGYKNPYSPEAEYQVELMHHGHAHGEDETPGIFAYPYYTMGVFLPFALIGDFLVARAAWMTLMELAHLAILFLTFRLINFNPAKFLAFSLIFASLFWADFSQALIDGNPSSLAALFAVLSLYFISRDRDVSAGVFLALSTIKPQLVILYLPFVWMWAFSVRRTKIIYASSAVMIGLLGLSFLFQPSWLFEFYKDLTTYVGVAQPSTPYAIMSNWMPAPTARIIALLLSVVSGFILFRVVKTCYGKDFPALLWGSSLIFVLMPLTGITSAKSNYVAMLPALVLLVWAFNAKRKIKELWLGLFILLWIPLSWVYFAAGRNWVVGGTLIYFVDFYPLPLVLLGLFLSLMPFKNPEIFSSFVSDQVFFESSSRHD